MKRVKSQSGAILVISLLILLILTVIGVAGMKTTTTEEKMAGNARDRELAFQSAEAALAVGENDILRRYQQKSDADSGTDWADYLNSSSATGNCDRLGQTVAATGNMMGTCGPYADDLDPFNAEWSMANSITSSLNRGDDLSSLKAPKYFIQLVRKSTTDEYIFKVTAKGYGGDENAEVILQSTFSVSDP